jgi:hypothetical protein
VTICKRWESDQPRPVQLPHDQAIARLDRGERLLQARAIIACPTGLVRKRLARIHPRVKQRIALQVGRLPVVVTGDLQVAYEYVRKTPSDLFSYTTEIQQSFSNRFCPVVTGRQSRASQCRQSPVSRIPKSGSITQEAQGTLRDQDGLRKRTVSRHAVGRPYILTGRQLTPRARGLPAMGPLARVPLWLYTYSYQ